MIKPLINSGLILKTLKKGTKMTNNFPLGLEKKQKKSIQIK